MQKAQMIKWVSSVIVFSVLFLFIYGGFNVLVDPFGVFGDNIFNWYAYNMINNPRVAKIPYIEKHHEEYDSYIIGCSKTSAISTELLNQYYGGARFYNMIMYGGDMYDINATAKYLIKNYKPKNIIINIGLEEADKFNYEDDRIKDNLHAKVSGENALLFYAKYFYANPTYSVKKLCEMMNKTYLPRGVYAFVPETGAYNKKIQNIEYIRGINMYAFQDIYGTNGLNCIDQCVDAIKEIKELCEQNGISFKLIASPIYYREVESFPLDRLKEYWIKLAENVDFWDFSGFSPVSYDERYFYDAYHFHNSVGEMMLARIFNDNSIYIPEGFGHYTTKDNVRERAENIFTGKEPPSEIDKQEANLDYLKKLPILIYHHFDPAGKALYTQTPERFKEDLMRLKEHGYTTVSYQEAVDFVLRGVPLPEKPVIISIDDGYYSNYKYAYPILKEMGMKATISLIGIQAGKSYYKDTYIAVTPYFSYEQAREMDESGLISIQSHSYAMHDNLSYEKEPYREGILSKSNESERDYISAFRTDAERSLQEIEEYVGRRPFVFTYPYGFYSKLSEVLLAEMGINVTVTVDSGVSALIKGMPQSLLGLQRLNVERTTDVIRLLEENI